MGNAQRDTDIADENFFVGVEDDGSGRSSNIQQRDMCGSALIFMVEQLNFT